ncbi:hypothetical protein MCOR18_011753 [Pyricularia oryzae]|nr:hypothetical protein MCOR18_011753 [Pyricularia oryzae]KAI6508195.1 hypothetical protein MCOR10_010991 [Pyricularia oryzae]
MRPASLTQRGSGSRYTSFQSTTLGVLSTMAVHNGSQSPRSALTSSRLPGNDHDSSMSWSSLWVSTQEQLAPFLMVDVRKCTSGPIQPLNVSPFSQNSRVRGSLRSSVVGNLEIELA